ncbi:MAG TPA: glycosyltransferase family 2 protein [Patescibacteria group bacterium]|nr:glycosyltransferase family 2 protein [Patescibacteria group bacterium]
MMKPSPVIKKVALVMVNFNGTDDTLALLDTVRTLDTTGLDFRTFLVDKTPGSWIGDKIQKDFPNLELIQAGADKGFTGGYNLGMRFAAAWGADYIAIINNDTLIGDPLMLKKFIEVLDENKDSIVSPKIYFAKGFEFKDRYSKKDLGKVLWYAGGEFDWANVRSVHKGIDEVDEGKYDSVVKTGFITGCCFMIKRHTLEKFGYFDEDLFAYFDDNDWQQRVLAGGGTLYYHGGTHIYHKVSQTMGIGSEQTDYLLTRNRLYFTFKYAKARVKFAVLREMLRQLVSGRAAQKRGVFDFIRGIKGHSPYKIPSEGPYHFPIRLSVIVSSYKTSKLTSELLKSIYKTGSGFDPKQDEVIVLDNGTDDDFSVVTKNFPQVRYLTNIVNKGFVGGNNRLFEYSRGEMVLMFNTDIEVKDNAIGKLIEASEGYNNEAVLTGKLLFPDGGPQDCCFNLPTITGVIKEYLLGIKGGFFMFLPKTDKPVKVDGGVMADFLIPRKVINKIGVLNRKLFMYFEDIDYCRRLKKAGIPVYFIPNAEFYHHHGATAKKIGKPAINKQIIESSKIYHGKFYYSLITAALWFVQKVNIVTSPISRWEKDR